MLLGDEVVGVLSMWRTRVAPFSERDMGLLDEFAAQAAIALRQVDLMQSLEARSTELASKVEQLEALREVGEAVSSSLDPDAVLNSIVSNAVRLTGTDGGSIMEYDERTDAFVVRAAAGAAQDLLDRAAGDHHPAGRHAGRPGRYRAAPARGRRPLPGAARPSPGRPLPGRLAVGARDPHAPGRPHRRAWS